MMVDYLIILPPRRTYGGKRINFAAANNNIISAEQYLLWLDAGTFVDTLNFQSNYWNLFDVHSIKSKIDDKEDGENRDYVDIKDFLLQRQTSIEQMGFK